jgi:predicted ATPase
MARRQATPHGRGECMGQRGERGLRTPAAAWCDPGRTPAMARRQQATSWELRVATSLARLWQQQDKRVEAYEILAEVYGWFTEGFDTADLQEAKALLEKLGR